jgi:hypothetical protein
MEWFDNLPWWLRLLSIGYLVFLGLTPFWIVDRLDRVIKVLQTAKCAASKRDG